jgi:hypothetical protein
VRWRAALQHARAATQCAARVATCHFLPECCATAARRFLNAERTKADNAANPTPLKWEDYKKKLLKRMNNNPKSNELISYILKTREE